MKKKKQSPVGLIIVLLITAAAILLVRHFHIKNFHIVEPEVLYTSGQPRRMDYTRLLYKYHIGTIVNVRSASEHRERNWHNEEITWVRSNGVKYVELPIEKRNYFPDKKTQEQFLAVMSDKDNLPVLLHGSGGSKRVPMLTAVWLIKSKGFTVEETLKVAGKIKKQPLSEDEKRFINGLTR
jgi:protein tyrosine/serine phosphatase